MFRGHSKSKAWDNKVNNSTTENIETYGKILTDFELAKALSMFFVSMNADIPALNINRLPV